MTPTEPVRLIRVRWAMRLTLSLGDWIVFGTVAVILALVAGTSLRAALG
jgi:hypothetical protein